MCLFWLDNLGRRDPIKIQPRCFTGGLNQWKALQGTSSFMGGESGTSWAIRKSSDAASYTEEESRAQNHHLRGIYKRSGQIRGSSGRNLCSSPFNRSLLLKLRHVLPQLPFWKLQHGIPQKSLSYPFHLLQCPLLYECELWRCPLFAQQLSRPYLSPGQLPRDLQRPNWLPASL